LQAASGTSEPYRGGSCSIGQRACTLIARSCCCPLAAGIGDHGPVVGAELRTGVIDIALEVAKHVFQRSAQGLVGADTPGDDQPLEARLLERPLTLDGQSLYHRLLERQGHVATGLFVVVASLPALLPGIEGKGFQATETHCQAWPIGHRSWEHEPARRAALGKPGNFRPTGVVQPNELGGLVERLAGRIVQALAEQLVLTDAIDAHQLGMTAGNQQGDERKRRRGFFQHGRQQMALHVVYTDGRDIPGKGQGLGAGGTDQECADQPGACGIGDGVDFGGHAARFVQHLADQRQHALDVIARCELGHHAAEYAVQVDLTEQRIGQQAPLTVV